MDDGQQRLDADPAVAVAVGNNIDSVTYLDIFGAYNFTGQLTLGVGIENLTDESSPVVTQLFENNGSADTTSAGIYDIRGTFWYVSLGYTFQ